MRQRRGQHQALESVDDEYVMSVMGVDKVLDADTFTERVSETGTQQRRFDQIKRFNKLRRMYRIYRLYRMIRVYRFIRSYRLYRQCKSYQLRQD